MTLRDRFIMGFGKGPVQDRLFEEKISVSFADAVSVASRKMATHSLQQQVQVKLEPEVLKVSQGKGSSRFKPQFKPSVTPGAQKSAKGELKSLQRCKVCGRGNHMAQDCRFKDYKCHVCGVQGHLAPVCSRKRDGHRVQNYMEDQDESIFCIKSDGLKPIYLPITIFNKQFSFQLDSGASVSVVSEEFWQSNLEEVALEPSKRNLFVYHEAKLDTIGCCQIPIEYNNVVKEIELFVVRNGRVPILGRDFMKLYSIEFIQSQINNLSSTNLEYLVNKYDDVFSEGLGTFNKGVITLKLLDEEVTPKFFRARTVPFGLRDKVEAELDRLVKLKVLTAVNFSQWATPIVPVLKKDGSIRICGDFKITINPVLEIDKFPLPRINDLFAKVHGSCVFSKIDLSQAYNQCLLDEKSKALVTISTHKGLYQYTRLPFGVASAPAKFQKIMESLLADLEGVVCFLDDVLICGKDKQESVQRIEAVLSRLRENGLKVSPSKCTFFQDEVSYLGYRINKVGLHPSRDKVVAINQASIPANITQLKSVLGMINYYGKFVPNLSTILAPLYELLKKGTTWKWTKECDIAFKKIKEILTSAQVLTHYNPDYDIKLSVDASPYGLGGVISHVMPNGSERPIAYASRTLSSSEKNWSQIEREACAIIFALKKFHQYLYCRPFTLVTDNKPLIAIFHPTKGIPQYSANRLRRWAIILSNYQYKIEYVRSDRNSADFLSRALPTKGDVDDHDSVETVEGAVNHISANVDLDEIKRSMSLDNTLTKVVNLVKKGWPGSVKKDSQLWSYFNIRHQLSLDKNLLWWNNRIVIPSGLRKKLLLSLHESHLGVVKMKQIARSYFFWPGINRDVERVVEACEGCGQNQQHPAKTILHNWKWPKEVFSRIHIDYLGPFLNKHFLVILDAHSKWVEVFPTTNITTSFTISALYSVIARFGIPRLIVSDNATNLATSSEFQDFLKAFNIKQITSAPYFPQSNGAAENAVKTVKNALKKAFAVVKNSSFNVNEVLNKFLFDYRNCAHATTGFSPAFLMFGRNIRTRFDIICDENVELAVKKKQGIQEFHFGGRQRAELRVGDKVMTRDYRGDKGTKVWTKAIIKKIIGKCTFLCQVIETGAIWKRHTNQIRKLRLEGSLPVSAPPAEPGSVESAPGKREATSPAGVFSPVRKRLRREVRPPQRLMYF
jgi:hypothetical protein